MIRKSKPRIQLLEPISCEQPSMEQEDAFNPQDDATDRLIQISSEQVHQNIFEVYFEHMQIQNNQEIKVKPPKEQTKKKQLKIMMTKCEKNRLSVVQNFTQSHRIWRKESVRLLEEQSKLIQKPQYCKNQSSFIIFQNGYLNNFNSSEYGHISFGEGFNRTQKSRPPRNIMSLIKRKNISNLKEPISMQNQQDQSPINSRIKYKRNLSPTQRVYKSCELKKEFQSISPIKITTNDKMPDQNIQLRCTNPNFRNKKISNYIKLRANVVLKKTHLS